MYRIIFCAVLPAFLVVWYIWWRDKYQREPFREMARAFGFGVLSVIPAAMLELLATRIGISPEEPATVFQAIMKGFLGAALPEEGMKLLMLWLVLRRNKYFDERFDGIVYAVCVGMGFAATENITYLFSNIDNWQSVAISRAIYAVPGHFMFAVAMGYFYSLYYFGDMNVRRASRILWIPVLFHGTYDSILFMMQPAGPAYSGALMMVFVAFCIWEFRYGMRRINEHLRRDREDPNQAAYGQ